MELLVPLTRFKIKNRWQASSPAFKFRLVSGDDSLDLGPRLGHRTHAIEPIQDLAGQHAELCVVEKVKSIAWWHALILINDGFVAEQFRRGGLHPIAGIC